MAERVGFEPTVRYQRTHDFQSCALDQLSHLSTTKVIIPYQCRNVNIFLRKNSETISHSRKRSKNKTKKNSVLECCT